MPFYLSSTSRSPDCHYTVMSHLMDVAPIFTKSHNLGGDPLESRVDDEHLLISLCSDGLSGMVSLENNRDFVRIEPKARSGQWNLVHLEQFRKLSLNQAGNMSQYRQLLEVAGTKVRLRQKLARHKRSIRASANDKSEPFVVELYLIVDSKMVEMYGDQSYSKLLRRITYILNKINIAFMEFNIYFVVTQLEIWEEDQIKLTDENHIIMELQLYKRRFIDKKHDCLHAILGENLGSAKRGQSERASMCAYNRCVGYTKNHRDLEELNIAHNVIHELGHNFGLSHDTERCKCFGCIMSTGVEFGILKFQWSVCSRKEISSLFKSGMADCLRDEPLQEYGKFQASILSRNKEPKPRMDISTTICGNGVVDAGEECDCGGRALCSDSAKRCCNPETCRLSRGSTCASGACCDVATCVIKQAGTVCRSVGNRDCDLEEYCDGRTQWCPNDVYKHDGVPCTTTVGRQSSHCYRGQCHSRQTWCRQLYGETADEGASSCYRLNRIGGSIKNCGLIVPVKEERDRRPMNWQTRTCSEQNEMCGRLWCSHSNERLMRSSPQFETEETVEGHHCSAARFNLDWFLDDAGMVPNGSPCGYGKMCWHGACVRSWSQGTMGCECHGHGVCNNLQHCHCDPGFAPPNCTEPGNGGSIDSGSSRTFSLRLSIIVASVTTTVIVIVALFAISILLYHFRTRKWPPFMKWIKWPEYQKPEFLIESREPNKFGRSDSRFIRCSISQFEKPPTSPRSPIPLVDEEYMFTGRSISKKTASESSPKTKNNPQWPSLTRQKTLILENISEDKPMQFQNPKLVPPKPLSDKPQKPGIVKSKPPITLEKPMKGTNVSQIQSQLNQLTNIAPVKPPLLSSKPNKSSATKNPKPMKPLLLCEKPQRPTVDSRSPNAPPQHPEFSGIPRDTGILDKTRSHNPAQYLSQQPRVIGTKSHNDTPPQSKISKINISQPRLEETTCNALTRELSSPDQALSRFVGPHKIIKVDANTAIKYLY